MPDRLNRHDLTARADAAELADVLRAAGVARWQVPENWSFVPEIPKTAVGKFDKKVLRVSRAAGELNVERL
jgi:fatty-acyl-CoA synthase